MLVTRLNQAKQCAHFISDVSFTIDMSRVSPRVRTLAKKIVVSRQFNKWSRSQSGILAHAVYTAFAPEGTPAVLAYAYGVNWQTSPDWWARIEELYRVDATLDNMRSHYRIYETVEESVARRLAGIKTQSYISWVSDALSAQREALVREALSLGAERDAEITAMMCEPLDNKRLVFTVNI